MVEAGDQLAVLRQRGEGSSSRVGAGFGNFSNEVGLQPGQDDVAQQVLHDRVGLGDDADLPAVLLHERSDDVGAEGRFLAVVATLEFGVSDG